MAEIVTNEAGESVGWREIERGAQIRPTRLFRPIIKYVTPGFLLTILVWWAVTDLPAKLSMEGVSESARSSVLGARLMIVAVFAAIALLVRSASRSWDSSGEPR